MARDDLSVLSAFLAVAEERSFTSAAKRLNVSQSALSHAVRGLEEEIGVRLLARTTRSVAPTDAGEELLRSLRTALTDRRAALGKISGQRDKPAGRVRLVVSPLPRNRCLDRGSVSSRATIRTWCSISRPMKAELISWPVGTTPASTTGSSSSRTWSPSASRRITARRSSVHRCTSNRIAAPSCRAICCSTAASTSDTAVTRSIAGSSTRASSR